MEEGLSLDNEKRPLGGFSPLTAVANMQTPNGHPAGKAVSTLDGSPGLVKYRRGWFWVVGWVKIGAGMRALRKPGEMLRRLARLRSGKRLPRLGWRDGARTSYDERAIGGQAGQLSN